MLGLSLERVIPFSVSKLEQNWELVLIGELGGMIVLERFVTAIIEPIDLIQDKLDSF